MEIKIKSCDSFVLDRYRTASDVKLAKDFSEEQIMNAFNKSKSFEVRNWYGTTELVTFTISNIEKNEYGDYIYTIKSSQSINKDYFPSIRDICKGCENVAFPISYFVQ